MTLLALASAFAADVHGPPWAPCLDGWVAWAPGTAAKGTAGACLGLEVANAPVVATITDAEGSVQATALGDLAGLHVGGRYGFGRLGVGVDLPIWLGSTGLDGENGAHLGDARVYLPVALRREGLQLDVVGEALLPLGDADALLGTGGPGAAAHVVLGGSGEALSAGLDLGIGAQREEPLPGASRALWLRLAGTATWRAGRRFSLGPEGWIQASPDGGRLPGELLLHATVTPGAGYTLGAALGTAVSPGVGASAFRGYVRVAWSPPARADRVPAPVSPEAVAGLPLTVAVEDPAGRPVDALVALDGGAPTPTGPDGALTLVSPPGAGLLVVQAEGYGTQTRSLLPDERAAAARVRVVLRPITGDAELSLAVRDPEGRPVEGASVFVDEAPAGETGSGGGLVLGGLAPGRHLVLVTQDDHAPALPTEVPTGTPTVLTLHLPPGSVRVLARGPGGPVPDARVRFAGPEAVGPADLGADGQETFVLLPGDWVAVVSAPSFGVQERELHVQPGRTSLLIVDVVLLDEVAQGGSLVVRAVGPRGEPVEGVALSLDGAPVGTTSNGGTLTLHDLAPGTHRVAAGGTAFRPVEREVELGTGARELLLPVAWRSGQVHLAVRGVEGAPVDARVRWIGPESLPPADLGPDGEATFELQPGAWTVAVSSPTYGVQERAVEVHPDDVARVEIVTGLLSADGDAALELRVRGPGGWLAGAEATLDSRPLGTTTDQGLRATGLRPGEHELTVGAVGHTRRARSVVLASGDNVVELSLDAAARGVLARALRGDRPSPDALVRAYGAAPVPPGPVGPDGVRALELAPGPWAVVAVSPADGIGQVDLDVTPGAVPLPADVPLRGPSADRAALLVVAVDSAGRPLPSAVLQTNGVEGHGWQLLEDLAPGRVSIEASAPGYAPVKPAVVDVFPGSQTYTVRLAALPRTVRVAVQAGGAPVDAEVRAFGPGRKNPVSTRRGVGTLDLLPGTWQLAVSARGFGPRRVEVEVVAGLGAQDVKIELGEAKVGVTGQGVRLDEPVHFAFDKADVEPSSWALLEQVAASLLLHPELGTVEIQGHTDNVGDPLYNLDLSQRRAEAVRAWLVTRGVDPGRLVAKGYGDTQPVAANTTDAGRARNRRVEVRARE